jgi:dipeptidase E
MKLYLSSYLLGDHPEQFAALVGGNKSVAIIMNAADIFGDAKRRAYLANEIEKMKALGLRAEELDLRRYFGRPDTLTKTLQNFDAVWVMGGNSFVLRRAMRQSGFDQIAVPMIKSGVLAYGGFSAGAVVATKNLKGIELVDDPNQLTEGYDAPILWEGLGLYDYSIAPHYKSDHPESAAIDKVVEYFEKENIPFKALHDGEAIVIT